MALLAQPAAHARQDPAALSAREAATLWAFVTGEGLAWDDALAGRPAARPPPPPPMTVERLIDGSRKAVLGGPFASMTARESLGRDLSNTRRVLTSRHLGQGANWQRDVSLSLAPDVGGDVTLGLSAGLFEARRPLPVSRHQLALREVERWGEHQGADMALELGLLGGKLRYSGSHAWSDYVRTTDSPDPPTSLPPAGGVFERRNPSLRDGARDWRLLPGRHEGRAWASRHRVDADLLKGKGRALSAYAEYKDGDMNFRSFTREGRGNSFSLGETLEYGGKATLGRTQFDLTHTASRAGSQDWVRTRGKAGYKAVTLTLYEDMRLLGRGQGRETRAERLGGELTLDLPRLGLTTAGSWGWLAPQTATLGLESDTRRVGRPGRQSRDSGRRTRGALSWGTDRAFTDVAVSRREPSGADLGEAGFDIDLSRTVSGNSWDASTYLFIGGVGSDAAGERWRDRWTGGGVSAAYYGEGWPDLTLNLEYFRFASAYPDIGEALGEQFIGIDLGIDFTKFLPDQGAGQSLRLNLYASPVARWDGYEGRGAELERAVSLRWSAPF